MASYYKRGKCFWVNFKSGSKRIRKPLKTRDGRPVREEKAAKYLTNEIENTFENGVSPIPRSEVLAISILAEYKEDCSAIKTHRTVINDCGQIRDFIENANVCSIGEINEDRLRQYLNERLNKKEIVNLTANHVIGYLSGFMNYAVKRGYVSNNPIKGMRRYPTESRPPRFYSKTEIDSIFKASARETLFPAILTAIYTGMRLGELERLEWSHIDKVAGTITVHKSKTKKFRVIPLHPELKKELKIGMLPFNFANERRILSRIRRKSKIKDVQWRICRHTFASHLAQAGVDLYKISKYMGHSSIETTQIYAHLIPDRKDILRLDF